MVYGRLKVTVLPETGASPKFNHNFLAHYQQNWLLKLIIGQIVLIFRIFSDIWDEGKSSTVNARMDPFMSGASGGNRNFREMQKCRLRRRNLPGYYYCNS